MRLGYAMWHDKRGCGRLRLVMWLKEASRTRRQGDARPPGKTLPFAELVCRRVEVIRVRSCFRRCF
jgi:hypothetical protein